MGQRPARPGTFPDREEGEKPMENALAVLIIAGAFLLACLGILALSFARKISK
jgi:hypothetical protein